MKVGEEGRREGAATRTIKVNEAGIADIADSIDDVSITLPQHRPSSLKLQPFSNRFDQLRITLFRTFTSS